MTLIVPNAREVDVLTNLLTPALTMKLYGNDVTPSGLSVASGFNEIAGGGYASKPIILANWGITGGSPTIALYNAVQQWTFTGAINAPGTIYGYFITRNSDGVLIYAERFPAGVVPFTPINDSTIRITPRITCESA